MLQKMDQNFGNERETQMISWLHQYFDKADPQLKSKVTVEEVKGIFNQKYPGETNNTFGNIVRKAFPGVQRGRDSVSYYYCPLKRKVSISHGQSFIVLTKVVESLNQCTQTLQSPNTPTEDFLKSQVTQLESTNSTLRTKVTLLEKKLKDTEEAAQICSQNNELLKRQMLELQAKNKKLKESVGKRHWADATNDGKYKRPKMLEVNMIKKDDLEGEEEVFIGEGYSRIDILIFS